MYNLTLPARRSFDLLKQHGLPNSYKTKYTGLIMGGAFRMYPAKDKDLLRAIREDDLRLFNDALQRGAHVNRSFDYGWRPLHWASFKGNQTMVEILIDRGAKSKTKNNDKKTPMDICCYDASTVDLKNRKRILHILNQGLSVSSSEE